MTHSNTTGVQDLQISDAESCEIENAPGAIEDLIAIITDLDEQLDTANDTLKDIKQQLREAKKRISELED